jgi:DNA-binding NarL/FixJ family response regulator
MHTGLVVEDIAPVSDALSSRLRRVFPGIEVSEAATLADARRMLSEHVPDIVLLDIGLPDGEGTQLLSEGLLAESCMVVMTTIFDDDEHLFAALRAGAQGYLLKDEPEQQFLDSLQSIAIGRPPLSPAVARKMLSTFHSREISEHKDMASLSVREQEVLSLIARGYSVRGAAEVLGLKHSTVAGYLKTVYQKLHVNTRAEATIRAMEMGLIKPTAH